MNTYEQDLIELGKLLVNSLLKVKYISESKYDKNKIMLIELTLNIMKSIDLISKEENIKESEF